ncbi:5-formyltetrahydrofolate cyclo-ligase [Nonomuraea turcica]|uniref:5-formyltetrahydrofolate cyclo-ligase n=1 Tax=Nonomuraea sp. G32 TaxID=3067274 RepID=UPI00273BD6E0|nr:5-formyltetrahydrofolate cyclo-ligase [Nonomuraea sp. G32]MDP4506816.1 5-formyltetrahydrofolate cyclo-ligase [Nonomuraea sp. G32]
MSLDDDKCAARERIWSALIEAEISAPDAHGHIPQFVGSDSAADLLATTDAWRRARTVKANPDTAQLLMRARALTEGKILYMAVPKIATIEPFYLIDPAHSTLPPGQAASSSTAAHASPRVGPEHMRPIDLIVCGTVAVNREGVRLGKGAGYSDIEVALLIEDGLVTNDTLIVTTVHSLQVVDEPLPETAHDFRVDLIVTEKDIITCPRSPRPSGVIWSSMPADKIAAIPILGLRAKENLS